MRSKIFISLLLVFSLQPLLIARFVRPWTLEEIFDKADLVVIASFVSTKDTDERSTLQDDLSSPVKVIGVTTEFTAELIFKGPKDITRFELHHYRFQDTNDARVADAAQLIRLPIPPHGSTHYVGHGGFLMFLIKEPGGRYAPVTGQTDPALMSVLDLTCK